MSERVRIRLGDVVSFIKGKKPSDVYETALSGAQPYILIENFSGAYRLYTDDKRCVECYPTDTLIVADGANCGLVSSGHRGYAGSTLGILRPDTSKLHPRFLFFYARSLFAILNKRVRGSAVPHLEKDIMLNDVVALPSLSEQQRIVRILEEVDTVYQMRDESDQRTDELIHATYHEMFPIDGNSTFTYRSATIEQLAERRDGSIRTGPFGSDLLHSEFTDTGVPVLGIDNVAANEFRWTTPRCIPEAKYQNFKRFRVYPRDVLITIMGTVGRCAVAPDDLPVCISTKHLCVISLDHTRINPIFLWASILFDQSIRNQTRAVGSGAIMEGWNSTIIKKLKIRLPSLPEQNTFSIKVSEINALKAQQAVSRKHTDNLFQSALYQAFQGEL